MSEDTAQGREGGRPDDGDGQHYESFVVRVLFNDDCSIRDTRMEHIGTGEVKRWAGWEHEAMLAFIQQAASRPLSAAAEDPDVVPHSRRTPAAAETATQPTVTAGLAPTVPSAPERPNGSQRMFLAPVARLCVGRKPLRAAEPFTMTMTLDLTRSAVASDRLAFNAVMVVTELGGGYEGRLAHASGLLATAGTPTIQVEAEGLPPGVYRLEGAVSLRAPGAGHSGALAATAEGILLQVLAD